MDRRVAVAGTGPVSAEAGVAAVRAGGNAVDAAIAAIVAAMSTEPGIVSMLGGAFVSIWPAGGEPEVIDGNVEMPVADCRASGSARGCARSPRRTEGA